MRTIAIASGKGGTGKTTIAINLTLALTKYGRQVILADGNFNNPNIGLMLGSTKFEDTIFHAMDEDRNISEIVYKHQSGLKIIPGDISLEKIHKKDLVKFNDKLQDLKNNAEAVVIDTDSSFLHENVSLLKSIDSVIIVVTPDLISISESLKLLKLLKQGDNKTNVLGIVINMKTNKEYDLSLKNIESILHEKIIGIIPYHDSIKHSLKIKFPVLYSHPDSKASAAFEKLACNLIGKKYKDPKAEKPMTKMESVMEKIGLKKWYETIIEDAED